MRSDELVNLPAQELEALSGFMLAGGTLGVVMTRPEDLVNDLLIAFVGGQVSETLVQPETLKEVVLRALPSTSTSAPTGIKAPPTASAPTPEVKSVLKGYEGGNLRHTAYGASAAYGLGEIHVLAFDPQTKPGVDSPWVHVRVVDMLRRANERTSAVLFRHGDQHTVATEVRQRLDPNESSRWAIVVTALLLCLYSVVAGPVNFTIWRNRHRPLQALIWLPIASAVTFGTVVAIGVGAKGCSGRSRHLTMVEVGAGMKRGTARKWRGFFVPTARELTVRTGSASSVLGVEMMDHGEEVTDTLRVDRGGLRIENLALRPWETLVVREDGYSDLGGGISLMYVGEKELKVKNKTGRRLRGLVLSNPLGGSALSAQARRQRVRLIEEVPIHIACHPRCRWCGRLAAARLQHVQHRVEARGGLQRSHPVVGSGERLHRRQEELVPHRCAGAARPARRGRWRRARHRSHSGLGPRAGAGGWIRRDLMGLDIDHGYPAIRARHLWHRYGNKDVLRDVTFDVYPGEIFGFIGPNGAGKTTTIRIMATLLEPMAGRVEIDGIDVTMEPEAVRKLIGYMQITRASTTASRVREYLEFFADAYRIPSLGVVDAVLELTDIGMLQDQLVVTLSKGQKQRLQLARILLHDPKVLILDEPASDLDPRARIEIRDLLFDLQSLGKTILLSSHILSELSDVCTSNRYHRTWAHRGVRPHRGDLGPALGSNKRRWRWASRLPRSNPRLRIGRRRQAKRVPVRRRLSRLSNLHRCVWRSGTV